jgi:DNA polymerase-3 subunit gamma/tau
MTYQVLARKWRPQEFASLIGQQAVVTALTNALAEGRVAQAYLFSGIRGVGKTTAARVFAKALNCERFGVGKAGGPCNECAICRDITSGADMDVLEIDAATYSKVEQVRELAESLKYAPTRARYKVVILDEVHRLSRQAFDALLKIVEEPPAHLVFIFATTEIDAVPATILSRCQEFHFRRVTSAELATHLATIAAAEKIRASDAALALIARAGEGSVRDAVAILDQLATFGNGEVDEQEAARLLGGIDLALFHDLLSSILAGESPRVSELARRVEENGWDPRQVHANFLGYCRDALHVALGDAGEALALPREERVRLAALARGAGYENLLRLLHQLLGSEGSIRRSESGTLALEIAWLRAAELPKLVAIEQILSGVPPSPGDGAPPGPRRISRDPVPPTRSSSAAAPEPPPVTALASAPVAEAERAPVAEPAVATPRPRTPPREGDEVEHFLEEVSRRKANLAGLLQGLATITWRGAERALCLEPHDAFASGSLARANNRELLAEAAVAVLGEGAALRILAPRPAVRSAPPEVVAREATKAEVREHPMVQSVLSVFGGDVAEVSRPDDEKETT